MSEERPYYGDNLSPEQRSRTMRAVRGRDTSPELKLRKAMRAIGLRGYRVDLRSVPGRPDVAFSRDRVAVFVDGGFWHGRTDRLRPGRSPYWDEKIRRNVERDRSNTLTLRERGWRVLRLWDDEVLADPELAAKRVRWQLTGLPAAEFFAGIGLMRMALEQVGFKVIFANDIDANKHAMYSANFDASHFWLGDIRYVSAAQVPTVAVATASFPCTDLSLAGSRNGLDGTQSGMFWEFVRILTEMGGRRPPVVLLENVAGLRSSKGGEDLATAISALNGLGYSCDLLQLDARRWVPQSRQRVFVVASTERIAVPGDWGPDPLRPHWIKSFVEAHPELMLLPARLELPTVTEARLGSVVHHLQPHDPRWWNGARLSTFTKSLSLTNRARLDALKRAERVTWRTAYRRTRHGTATWEIRHDEISGCLRTARGGSSRQALVEVGQGKVRVRWMTSREYARLMGAPDLDLQAVTENQALFGLGDAVCVPAIEWLARAYLMPLAAGELYSSGANSGSEG